MKFARLTVGLLSLHCGVVLSANICDGLNSRSINKFQVYELASDSSVIVVRMPFPSGLEAQNQKGKERSELALAARKVILQFVHPGAQEISYEFEGLQTQVASCQSQKVIVYFQSRSGLRKISVSPPSSGGSKPPAGPNASELFDITKGFSPEQMLGNSSESAPSQ